ncbi:MAG TPA: type II secretion system F family protein [Thermoplasmata archaeon]|nr:type II secretion system F family protein [Thermoplasmata archaeon]
MARKELEEARVRLYSKKDRTRLVMAGGLGVFGIFLLIGILNLIPGPNGAINTSLRPGDVPMKRFLTWFVLALAGFMGPFGFYLARKQKNIKQIERRLPEFLRDVAEAGRFGMTLAEAIVVASSGRYGKLTPEIKKMAAQISWGVPATEALRLFAQRVDTPKVNRVVSIIVKSSDAGGDVADVLTMVSHDARETQLTEDERKITMSTYIAVIYISFLVFLVTIWILNVTFLPKIKESAQALTTQTQATGTQVTGILPENIEGVILGIQIAFFVAAIVHATGDGILAGVLDNGKIANGLRHSFIMLLIALVSFQLI